jgi:L-threonylcarbamoyladenylate synthase
MKPRSVRARTYRGTPRNLTRLAQALRAGELVAVPTETVYGLAANALDAAACRRIFSAKGRPAHDPLIVHVHSLAQLFEIARPNDAAFRLAQAFWPGPLTLVLPKKSCVPDVVSAGLPSVAVRMPSHPLFRRLLQETGLPLAAPSANPFGYVSPTTAAHVMTGLGRKISHVLDGGAAAIGLESTIVDLRNSARPRLLRPGAITLADVERVLGRKVVDASRSSARRRQAQLSPGRLARHYSPRTPVVLHARLNATKALRSPADEAWLFLRKPAAAKARNIFWLDDRGQLRGAAHRLFGLLRTLDARAYRRIHVELTDGTGLGAAINDRLRRAAAK